MQPADDQGKDLGGLPEWRRRPERSNTLAMRFITWVALTLGRRVARLFLAPICIYFLLFSARATRAAARKYLGKALGRTPGWLDLYRHYHAFAATILDRVFLFSGRFEALDIRPHNLQALQAAMALGRGCILLGAHVGSFEAVRGLARTREEPPANMVMYEDNARKLNAVLHAINPELSKHVIELGKPDSMLKVRDALRRGEYVGILADRVIEGEGSVVCEFMGEAAKFPVGPLRMAGMLKVPVLAMAGLYMGGNQYEIYFDRLLARHELDARLSDTELEQAVCEYAARIECYCRLAPYNWFNFYDFWV